MRLRRDALLALAASLIAAGIALVAVFVGKGHPFRHGGFITGVCCLGVGAFLIAALLIERPRMSARHYADLRNMLMSGNTAILGGHALQYARPRSESDPEIGQTAFRAHFRRIAGLAEPWNAAVARLGHARRSLTARFRREVETTPFHDGPYRRDVIARDLDRLTSERAAAGTLEQPLDLALGGAVWTAGYVVEAPPVEGLHIAQDRGWAIDMTGVPHGERYEARAEELIEPVNELLVQAQSWPEATELHDATVALALFDRQPLVEAIDKAVRPNRFKFRWRCPDCRGR